MVSLIFRFFQVFDQFDSAKIGITSQNEKKSGSPTGVGNTQARWEIEKKNARGQKRSANSDGGGE